MNLDDIVEVIAGTGVVSDMDNFNADKSFELNGIDSLDTYTILLALEEKADVELADVPLDKIDSAAAIQAYIAAK